MLCSVGEADPAVKAFTSLLAAGIITTIIAGMVRPSVAATQCGAYGQFGQTNVLGTYYGAGLQCLSDNSSFVWGTRSTQAGGGLLEPIAGLTYEISPWENWTLRLKANIRELIGDYEVNSLPELSLAWKSPHLDDAVQFMLAAVWGSYTPTTITGPIQRIEFLAAATFPDWKIAPAVTAQVTVTGGYATYSTSDAQSWLEADLATWGNLSPTVDWYVTFRAKTASGISPLKFDVWSGDVQASPGLTFHLDSQWAISVRGTWSFQSATMSSLAYEIRTTVFGPVLILGYDPVGRTLSAAYDAPNFGNISLRYDGLNSAFFAVFQPR